MCKENKMGFLATIPEKCELRFNNGIPEATNEMTQTITEIWG
jgi:hypothetical protein